MVGLSSPLVWGIGAGALFLFATLTRSRALFQLCLVLGLAIGATDLVTYQILKPAVARPRPCYALKSVHLGTSRCGSDYGFPSNHAANAMAAAVVLSVYFKRRRARCLFFGAAAFVGLSRVYLGVHYPLDVMSGFAVGGAIGWLARGGVLWRVPPQSQVS